MMPVLFNITKDCETLCLFVEGKTGHCRNLENLRILAQI